MRSSPRNESSNLICSCRYRDLAIDLLASARNASVLQFFSIAYCQALLCTSYTNIQHLLNIGFSSVVCVHHLLNQLEYSASQPTTQHSFSEQGLQVIVNRFSLPIASVCIPTIIFNQVWIHIFGILT